jgi:MraZ protein
MEQDSQFGVMFVGEFVHSLDPKKRLTIPSEWREMLGQESSLYVLPNTEDRCLIVLPAKEMMVKLQRLRTQPILDPKARQFSRILASKSDLTKWDAQGRIRIKDDLLDYASLKEQVVMVAAFQGFELWSPEAWAAYSSDNPDSLSSAASYVGF